MSKDGIPSPSLKENVGLSVYVREGSASIAAFSVPFNTVYNNIVSRGRGGYY